MKTHTPATLGHSDPSWRVPLDLPTEAMSPELVSAGDIVYTRRAKGYQRLTALAGDTWRHVGVVATIGGFPWLIDMGHGGYGARPFTTVLKAYDTIAVQRLDACGRYCDHRLVNDVALQMNFPKDFYTTIEQGLIGLGSLLRLQQLRRRALLRTVDRQVRRALPRREGLGERAVCTTPVARALSQLCDRHDIQIDVSATKGAVAHEGRAIETDIRFAMPDDLWRALQRTSSGYWVKRNNHVDVTKTASGVDIDLTVERKGVPA